MLGVDTPCALLNAVFYYNGRGLCLRGGQEHRSLKLSQIVLCDDPPHYVYTENGSKNRNGGINQRRVENKVVPVFPSPESGVRCHFTLLKKYISSCHPLHFRKIGFI